MPSFEHKDGEAEASEAVEKGEEQKIETMPISKEFLARFFTSSVFLNAMRETVEKVNKFQGREFGFAIFKDVNADTILISDPIAGEYENVTAIGEAIREVREKLQEERRGKTFIVMGTLHFHSLLGKDPIIIPSGSEGDLGVTAAMRYENFLRLRRDTLAIEMIAARTTSRETKILVYQEPLRYTPASLPASFEEVDKALDRVRTQEEVLEVLREGGYKVSIVKTRNGTFTREGLADLQSFEVMGPSVT